MALREISDRKGGKVDNREQQSGSADGPVFPVASLFFCAGFVSLKLNGSGRC